MSKILWIADGGCATGFGRVTHAIGERLVSKYGDEVHVLAINYRGDPYPTNLHLWPPTLQRREDTYGLSRVIELLNKLQPDAVVMLNDPQILNKYLFENRFDPLKVLTRFPILAYIPVDGYDLPKLYDPVFAATKPVAMSKFGQAQIVGSELVYHGVDSDQFWPVSSERPIVLGDVRITSKRQAKEVVGLPKDEFIVGRIDRNSGRKDYAALWKALQPVMKRHSDLYAYFHCKGRDEQSGTNLEALLSRDPETRKQFRLPNPDDFDTIQGYPQEFVNCLYNAFDVFVSTSRGEGFGLTIAEALACGVPVIAQNVSSIPEVVGPGGELIEPQRAITVPFGQDQMLADIGAFSEAIEHAYSSSGWRREKGKAGRDHVTRSFVWDEAADKFHEHIEVLAHGSDGNSRTDPGTGRAHARASRAARRRADRRKPTA
jgi:glycosyltransferase involved in cell wall biosynthesis